MIFFFFPPPQTEFAATFVGGNIENWTCHFFFNFYFSLKPSVLLSVAHISLPADKTLHPFGFFFF